MSQEHYIRNPYVFNVNYSVPLKTNQSGNINISNRNQSLNNYNNNNNYNSNNSNNNNNNNNNLNNFQPQSHRQFLPPINP